MKKKTILEIIWGISAAFIWFCAYLVATGKNNQFWGELEALLSKIFG